ncbi:Uncharacterised protein [Klebsiella variicola]|nr:Uncharacterised protein [Klebsiella variicola]
MSNTSQPQGEQGGKHPAREAPAEHGEVPRKRDDSKDDKTDPYQPTRWSLARPDHEILKGTVMPRPQKRRRFGITHYTFCSTSSQEESHGDS